MKYPKIYITMDNCFAIKRWVEPAEWMKLIKEIGFPYAQASFDNEADMIFSPKAYLDQWYEDVAKAEKETGVRVATFFTGYTTYRTAGLAHPDDRLADRFTDDYMIEAVKRNGKRGTHIGIFCSAFPEKALQDPAEYKKTYDKVVERFSRIGKSAEENGIYFCTEAMYSPNQPSFTIEGTKQLLKDIYAKGHPIYTTVDVGHMVGQRYFRKPTDEAIRQSILEATSGAKYPSFWMGALSTLAIWEKAVSDKDNIDRYMEEIKADMDKYPHMFSTNPADDDPYAWLEALGAHSPIMHLQQTDGKTSGHHPFTKATNETGIIEPDKVFKAIAKAYEAPDEPGMPPKTDEIYLAFELFNSNTAYPYEVIDQLKETARYWRKYIPKDGVSLEELI